MEPLQHYSWATGSFTMSGELYGRSGQHECVYTDTTKPQVWSTAGYDRLTATVGIVDDDRDALGNVGQVSIQNQDGVDLIDPFDVSLGSTHPVDIDLDGAVQIQIFCWGRESETSEEQYDFYAVFGDAALYSDPN